MSQEDFDVLYPTPGKHISDARKDQPAKRVDFVTLRMVKESSLLYARRQIRCAEDAVELVHTFFDDSDREKFMVVVLDTKHRPTCINLVSIGSLDASIVHPREVFKTAVLANASGILCLHNHPSGDPTPSTEDIAVTRRLCDAGKILGIDVVDHIVVGDCGRFESLKAKGLM